MDGDKLKLVPILFEGVRICIINSAQIAFSESYQ